MAPKAEAHLSPLCLVPELNIVAPLVPFNASLIVNPYSTVTILLTLIVLLFCGS